LRFKFPLRGAIPFGMRALLTALSAVLLSACCHAPPLQPVSKNVAWQIPTNAWFLSKIPPPPAPDTAEARRDLATVLALQAQATPAKIAQAKRSYDLTIFTLAPAVSANFTPENYPQTAKFFLALNNLVNDVNNTVKEAYKRPHPFQVSDKVRQFVIAEPGYSYPSYHAARCVVFQHVLDQLDPGHDAAFTRISRQIQEDRVFAGEHFPSDIAGGIRLGKLIWGALEKNGHFRAAVGALKEAEWTPPPTLTADCCE
jgi:acid phosphatase (class A)